VNGVRRDIWGGAGAREEEMGFGGMNGGMGEREKSLLGVLRWESLRRDLRRVRLGRG
jgi:hypothetical protein